MKQGIIAAMMLLSGCSYFQPNAAEPQTETLHYSCGTLPLTVKLNNAAAEVSLILDGNALTLKEQPAASGTRYSDGHYTFWSKGNTAFIERNDKVIIDDCQLQSAG